VGALIGGSIDGWMKPLVYMAPGRQSDVVVSPIIGKDRQGVLLSVRF
jgi:hypothetical protein